MYTPKSICVLDVRSKEEVAKAVNSEALAIHIPKEYCKEIFGYVKNTATENTSNRKAGKIITTGGGVGLASAISALSPIGIIGASALTIFGLASLISGCSDKLNKYHVAFFEDGSIGLINTNHINFKHDTFAYPFSNYTFVKASDKKCPKCGKSLPSKFTRGRCPKCSTGNIELLYNSKKLVQEMRKNKVKI